MDCNDVMQLAADHAAQAESTLALSTSVSRAHTELAKLYTAMAREVRIGSNRHRKYGEVFMKPVVVIPPPTPQPDLDAQDDEPQFGDVTAVDPLSPLRSDDAAGTTVPDSEV